MHHGMTFNFGSAKVCSPAIFETCFSYDKDIWIPATDYCIIPSPQIVDPADVTVLGQVESKCDSSDRGETPKKPKQSSHKSPKKISKASKTDFQSDLKNLEVVRMFCPAKGYVPGQKFLSTGGACLEAICGGV